MGVMKTGLPSRDTCSDFLKQSKEGNMLDHEREANQAKSASNDSILRAKRDITGNMGCTSIHIIERKRDLPRET